MVVAQIEEPCAHDVQFGGMCANCGKDMTECVACFPYSLEETQSNFPNRRSSYVTDQVDATRAQISMVHDNVSLRVSQDEATKVEEEAKRRLLASKKLSLVVDLDQTIIHATVDPTVAEWQKDLDNPNHAAVKDVRAFQLVDDGPGARGCWYYIKLRPMLKEFLENVSKIYELHIYTMGTRAYAQHIANIIDPERKIFGDRILSRDESGSLVAKNLQRLFPVDTKMVVIIDDRGDVWKWNENLIKVTPYDFFVGIGDINSSFLPKKPEFKHVPKALAAATPSPKQDLAQEAAVPETKMETNGSSPDSGYASDVGSTCSTSPNESALEQLVSMGGGDDPIVLEAQNTRQDEALAAQLQDRPLLQKQKELDEEEAVAEATAPKENGNSTPSDEGERPRHNLLQDHDAELFYLEQSLTKVHSEFFDNYARQLATSQGGRLAELRGSQGSGKRKPPPDNGVDLAVVPDVKIIMPSIKSRVFANTVLVFSGVVPLGIDIQTSDMALWAKSFGARIEESINRRTTHVIAARNRTAKVRQAVRKGKGRIKIVNTGWLMDSIVQWKRLDEGPYLLKIDEADVAAAGKAGAIGGDDFDMSSDMGSSTEIDTADATDTELEGVQKTTPGASTGLTINTGSSHTGDETDDEDVAELERHKPGEAADPQSPIGGSAVDWEGIDAEFAEFMADGDEDDEESGGDTSSVASGESGRSSKKLISGRKRGRSQVSEGGEDDSDAPSFKKSAVGKPTNLSQSLVANGEEAANGLGDEDMEEGNDVNGEDEDGDGWSDLEAEMEKAVSEEETGVA